MKYTPTPDLIDRFHVIPTAYSRATGLVYIWDPRPTIAEPDGAVWGVLPGDWRHQAALDSRSVNTHT